MSSEKEIVSFWYNQQNYLTSTNIPSFGNKDIFMLAVKPETPEAIHIEIFASLSPSGNIMMDASDVQTSVDNFLQKKFISTESFVKKYLENTGCKTDLKRAIIIGQMAKSIRIETAECFRKKNIQPILLEDVLADTIAWIDRIDRRSPALRCIQLFRHALISEPTATARLLESLNDSVRHDLFLKLATNPLFSRALERKRSEKILANIISSSSLSNTERLADALEDILGPNRMNRLLRILLHRRLPPESPNQKHLLEFLEE